MSKSRRHSALRSSRRAPELQDKDFDHEIDLIDQCESEIPALQTPGSEAHTSADLSALGDHPLGHSESQTPLAPTIENDESEQPAASENGDAKAPEPAGKSSAPEQTPPELAPTRKGGPSIVVQPATPLDTGMGRNNSKNKRLSQTPRTPKKKPKPEVTFDVLWENQRGGFFCGLPLFSSAALGNLDPPAWTNSLHKPSPTDIHTAQVPDPSWEWKDPEWRINHDTEAGIDEDGWEYSFMFSKKFSWHRARWWNSFVRRRAWIRQRIKKEVGYEKHESGLMNGSYFQVTPKRQRHRSPSRASWTSRDRSRSTDRSSCAFSQMSAEQDSHDEFEGDSASFHVPEEVPSTELLLSILKRARIDREKLEAIEVYIKTCQDELLQLQEHMHDIMGLFIFQASRKLLLKRLVRLLDELGGSIQDGKGKAADSLEGRKRENLRAAIKHADEELRKLEYWSDIKGMVEGGESVNGADSDAGWKENWEGVDNSGPKGP